MSICILIWKYMVDVWTRDAGLLFGALPDFPLVICIPLLVSRVNGHTKVDRGARDSAMGFDSASMMSSELESSSFVDSEEDEDTSRLVLLLSLNSSHTRESPRVSKFPISFPNQAKGESIWDRTHTADIKLLKNKDCNIHTSISETVSDTEPCCTVTS